MKCPDKKITTKKINWSKRKETIETDFGDCSKGVCAAWNKYDQGCRIYQKVQISKI